MERKIRVLGIAPYEGMKVLMSELAEEYPQIDLTLFVGDMEQGVEMSAPEKIAFQQGNTMLELADDINVQGGRVNMQ